MPSKKKAAKKKPAKKKPQSSRHGAITKVAEGDETSIKYDLANFAELPEYLFDGDAITELDHYTVLDIARDICYEVEEDLFESDCFTGGGADFTYKVYANDVKKCRKELREALMALLKKDGWLDQDE